MGTQGYSKGWVNWRIMIVVLALFVLTGEHARAQDAAEAQEPEPAEIKVKGYGFFGNRELRATLKLLHGEEELPPFLRPSFIEDSVLVLFSRLERDGYLNPSIKVVVTDGSGEERSFTWEQPLQEPLPRTLEVKKAVFQIEEGVLFYYDFIGFRGLDALSLDDAVHFFIETDALIPLKSGRVYSPENLSRGVENLRDALRRDGYQSARVNPTNLMVLTNTGAVTVDIVVEEGPRSFVRSIQGVIHIPGSDDPPSTNVVSTNLVYSETWRQDYRQQLRKSFYEEGYADTTVEILQLRREPAGTNVFLDLQARVRPGERIRVGQVMFRGNEETSERMLRRKVRISEGDLLDPITAERGRYTLARLGIFDSIELTYEQHPGEDMRDVVYTVEEGKEIDINLLFGYGSYELLRGGFEIEQYNLWGLAHHSRLRAIQSFKSTRGDYTYTMPELLGRDFDAFGTASYLRREEISFLREEFGAGAGVRRVFRPIDTDVSLRYQYQVLNASELDPSPADGLLEANVGSFIFDLRHDRRDNPLVPREGYKVLASLEVASEVLLGDVDYQRVETGASYHLPIGRSTWLHFGIAHGFVTTDSGPENDLPFNKRFFPGGDSSIRGFQYGEAAPRNEEGMLVGAEAYMLANLEFEQALTRSWSFVLFFDALGMARRLDSYPFDEELYSAGGGLRWKTIIGPVRFEYGHNLNPREEDPSGTFHLSVGFPF